MKGHGVLQTHFQHIFLGVSVQFSHPLLMQLSLLLSWHAFPGNQKELNSDDLLLKGLTVSGYWDWDVFRIYWSCPR